jgi:hypothetical protein
MRDRMRIAVFRVKRYYYYVFSMGTVTLNDMGTRGVLWANNKA